MVLDPKTGKEVLDPVQAPSGEGTTPAAGTPDPTKPGAAGNGQPDPNDPKVVPITALHEERDKRQGIQAQLDGLKALLGDKLTYDAAGMPIVNAPTAQPNSVPAPNAEWKQRLDELWESDPRKAMQVEMQAGIQAGIDWYDGVSSAIDIQEDELKKTKADYDTYRSDVRKYIRRLPPQQRAGKGMVEAAYFIIKGQQVDQIMDEREKLILEKVKNGESVTSIAAGTSSTSSVPKPIILTEDQKKAADAMNVSYEEYTKNLPPTRGT